MKKIIKVMSVFLLALFFGLLTKVSGETYNVNDEINLGQYNIYCRQGNAYVKYRGVGQFNYMYYYKDFNNVEHKAFCLNLGLTGAEGGDYTLDASTLISDPKVASILISGSPYKTLAELGLNNEDEASFATQFAVWTYLNNLDLNLLSPFQSGNENVVEAIKKIYWDGMNMAYTTEAILNLTKNGVVDVDNINSSYYSIKYNISHNTNIKNTILSTLGINGVIITDLNNNPISSINNVSEFKILIPRSSVTKNEELTLNFHAEAKQTSVMFGATSDPNRQNMGLLLDPLKYKNIQDKLTVNYKTFNITVKKTDKDTSQAVSGVTFRFQDSSGNKLGDFTTNANGIISVDVQKDLGITSEQNIKVTEIAVPSNYVLNTSNTKTITIKWGNTSSIAFTNEKKKAQIKVIKVDLDNNQVKLQGVKFNVLNSKNQVVERLTTNANGEATTNRIPIDETYKIQEVSTLQNYVLNNEVKTVTLTQNEIKNVTFTNEKKKAQIKVIKVDLDNNQVKLQGVKFNVLNSKNQVVQTLTTNANGEATTNRIPIDETYKIQEVSTLQNYVLNNEVKTVTLSQNEIKNITFTNELKKGQIKVIKVDKYNNELRLQGIEFKVFDEDDNLVETLITDENGEAITKRLRIDKKYKIQETKTLEDYDLTTEIKTVTLTQNQITDITFENELKKGRIRIIKVDLDNNEVKLKDIKFEIYDQDNNLIDSIVTDENGEAITKHLRVDKTYTVKEVETLNNYVLNENSITVTLKPAEILSMTFTNELKKGKIKVIKVDKYNNEVRLKGIEFKVFDEDNNLVDTLITDENGEAITKRLRIDKEYTIQETKTLEDYDLNEETKTVTLTQDQITNITFENELKKGRIRIIKVDLDDNEVRLKGIEFKVFDEDDNLVDTLVTDANGEAITKDLRVDKTYTVKETRTLENYVLNEEEVKVTLKPAEIKEITFENEKIKGQIKVIKLSTDDNKYTKLKAESPIKDVEFKVYDIENNLIETIITDENGIAITGDLLKGRYILKETKQGKYYLLNEETFEFEIKNHREVLEQVVYNDSVDIDIEIEKTGFIETQNKDNIFYNFKNIHNKSNVPLDNFTWNDLLPTEAVRLDKIYTGTWNEKLEYSVWYKTNKNDFKMFIDKLDSETVYELDFNDLELEEDEYIIEFEFRFGTVKVDFKENESPIVFVNMLDNLKNGFTFTNHTKVSGDYLKEHIEDKDKWTTIIYNREVKLNKELPKTR